MILTSKYTIKTFDGLALFPVRCYPDFGVRCILAPFWRQSWALEKPPKKHYDLT
jgi:hypothetical protein